MQKVPQKLISFHQETKKQRHTNNSFQKTKAYKTKKIKFIPKPEIQSKIELGLLLRRCRETNAEWDSILCMYELFHIDFINFTVKVL